jgi:hypothetical protein
MKIKWNWGTKLTIAIILFMSFIFTLVYLSTQNSIILVEKDYYPKGLVYQKRINSIKNAKAYHQKLEVRQARDRLTVKIPGSSPDSGNITFYRPDQEKINDLVIAFERNKPISVSVSKNKLKKGIYVLKLSWWQKSKEHYIEEKIFINK